MTKPFLFAAAISIMGCSSSALKPNQFQITGQVSGFKDSTMLFLEAAHKDSTYIIGNKFQFNGTLNKEVAKVIIHTKDFSDYKYLWLEPSALTFNAAKGDFKRAKITGSKTNALDTLDLVTAPLYKQMDSIRLLPDYTGKIDDIGALQHQVDKIDQRFIENNPNTFISADMLATYATTWGKETSQHLYNKLSAKMRATDDGRAVARFLTLNKPIVIGKPFVDLMQYAPDGKIVNLSDFKGKVVLLDFWASWCGPCRAENPNQVKNYNLYKDKGFCIYAVSVDNSKRDWLDAVKKDGLPYTNVSTPNGGSNPAELIYGVMQYPTNYLIDKNGIIIGKDLRGIFLDNALKNIFAK